MVNVDLVNKCLDRIKEKPANWYQNTWVSGRDIDDVPEAMVSKIEQGADALCGSTACMAGTAMIESGEWKPVISNVEKNAQGKVVAYDVDLVNSNGENPESAFDRLYDASELDDDAYSGDGAYAYFGAKLLGLSEGQAHTLFLATDYTDPDDYAWFVKDTLGIE